MKPKTLANEQWLENVQRAKTGRVVVLLSGGIDSAAVAVLLKDAGFEVRPLFIDYGQAALEAELFAATRLAEATGIEAPRVLKCDVFAGLAGLLPVSAHTDIAAWVPARNTLFMLLAGIYAHSINADGIAIGYMLDDNFVFGDNDYFHHRILELLLSKSFLRPFEVLLPAQASSKADLIALLENHRLLRLTVSCWNARLVDGCIEECGGTLHKAARRGHQATVVFCTRNEQGRWGEESLDARRQRAETEAEASSELLGFNLHFLDFEDMCLADNPSRLLQALIGLHPRSQPRYRHHSRAAGLAYRPPEPWLAGPRGRPAKRL